MISSVRNISRETCRVLLATTRNSSSTARLATNRPPVRRSPPRRSTSGSSSGKWLMLGIPVASFCLGTWQIQRRKWKEDLIEKINERKNREPQPLPDILEGLDWSKHEYARFRVRGTFDHSQEIHVHPRTFAAKKEIEGGSLISMGPRVGAHVITPFYVPERGYSILVNRGFVDKHLVDPETRKRGQVEGEVEIVGLLRLTEKNKLQASNNIEQNQWGFVDVEKMAEVKGTAPILLDAVDECTVPGGPIGGQTRIRLWNQHMSYIITWYSLSAITFIMWYNRFLRKLPVIR